MADSGKAAISLLLSQAAGQPIVNGLKEHIVGLTSAGSLGIEPGQLLGRHAPAQIVGEAIRTNLAAPSDSIPANTVITL
ncbi:MAG: hypothetical protein HC828_01740 [Blastochloris sp.]|nr:hypothetical protein [Blastochloris sp.]